MQKQNMETPQEKLGFEPLESELKVPTNPPLCIKPKMCSEVDVFQKISASSQGLQLFFVVVMTTNAFIFLVKSFRIQQI